MPAMPVTLKEAEIREIGNGDMLAVTAKYTRSGRHLHNCYTFELQNGSVTVQNLSAYSMKSIWR
jgi:hypothetical protein